MQSKTKRARSTSFLSICGMALTAKSVPMKRRGSIGFRRLRITVTPRRSMNLRRFYNCLQVFLMPIKRPSIGIIARPISIMPGR